METYFKSVLEQDPQEIVICDLNHTILYMNPAAISAYSAYGGAALLGRSLLDCHSGASVAQIHRVIAWFASSKDHNLVHTVYSKKENADIYMVALRDNGGNLIGYYEKHACRTRDERALYQMD